MSIITLNLPDDIDKELSKLKVGKESFLLEAVREKLKAEKMSNLENLLREGYQERRSETNLLSKNFFHSDLENWNEY
jgi:predicted CopG family antitoxin